MVRGEAVLSFLKSEGAVPPLFEKWGGIAPLPPSISATEDEEGSIAHWTSVPLTELSSAVGLESAGGPAGAQVVGEATPLQGDLKRRTDADLVRCHGDNLDTDSVTNLNREWIRR